jgi:CRISPR/Cas system-associated exonuclease Cas4 (RecB family)
VVIGGGKHLQPVLYALTCEKLLDAPVESGRLYYCTLTGGYEERIVPLDDFSRGLAAKVVESIDRALSEGFLPAAPEKDGCKWCDYRLVCGPNEERRVTIKPKKQLEELKRLREMP